MHIIFPEVPDCCRWVVTTGTSDDAVGLYVSIELPARGHINRHSSWSFVLIWYQSRNAQNTVNTDLELQGRVPFVLHTSHWNDLLVWYICQKIFKWGATEELKTPWDRCGSKSKLSNDFPLRQLMHHGVSRYIIIIRQTSLKSLDNRIRP